jgi:hypothetical protein
MVHICNLSTCKIEAEGPQVREQSELHSETLSQKIKQNKINIVYVK